MEIFKYILGAVVGALLVLGGFIAGAHGGGSQAGATSRAYDVDMAVKSFTLATSSVADVANGSNDTISGLLEGTCNLTQTTVGSFAATTSKEFYCAFTGARSGDTVIIELPTAAGGAGSGSASALAGFVKNSSYATTSNVVAVTITNLTGAATTTFPQATTSAHVLIVR